MWRREAAHRRVRRGEPPGLGTARVEPEPDPSRQGSTVVSGEVRHREKQPAVRRHGGFLVPHADAYEVRTETSCDVDTVVSCGATRAPAARGPPSGRCRGRRACEGLDGCRRSARPGMVAPQ